MGIAGNAQMSDERRRLDIALRGHNADTVIERARQVPDLTLADGLTITVFLARRGDDRFDRYGGRLLGRLLLERPLDLEAADVAQGLVAALPAPEAVAQLRGFIDA